MSGLSSYLPEDRVRAIANRTPLSSRTSGTVLIADISGFTTLTEVLCSSLGARRGAEELTHHLDAVYIALIAEVERYGGSVIGFAGDAITCWFDASDDTPALRAAACAFALQQAVLAFHAISLPGGATTAMALKVSLATGTARRFVVGDPGVHYIDTLAGATVARSAAGELLANQGDVIADAATVAACQGLLAVRDWYTDPNSSDRFAVVEPARDSYELYAPQPAPALADFPDERLRDWIAKPLLSRTRSFPTEFRPCVAVFVRFLGIDYEADEAEGQLDVFVRLLQRLTSRYDGALLQLTIGDKGSYAYVNLGAVSAHEDDTRRAVKLALALRDDASTLGYLDPLQIGIAAGTMRVGAYGAKTRRTFGALSDDVNLSARLMQSAAPGEILVSGRVREATNLNFLFEPRLPLQFKGLVASVPVFSVVGERQHRPVRLQEPSYALPIVGREEELETIGDRLAVALTGQEQVVGIVGEAGLGKSRLVAEVIRLANGLGFAGYGGACQSDAVNTPYHAWKTVWQAFFNIDPAAAPDEKLRQLEREVRHRAPDRLKALPLLGILLNIEIPDNEFTQDLDPKYRQSALYALLEDCLRAAARQEPLLIVVEDLHWIDALSHDLLETLVKALTDSRACIVLAYRPPKIARIAAPRLESLPYFTRVELHELSAADAEQAILAKLGTLYPAGNGDIPAVMIKNLTQRSQGNPFYLEELLNYLHDRRLDPRDPRVLDRIELPDSLHALVLSRIDQFGEREKTTLRAASIIGRLFRVDWLTGYYTDLGDQAAVKPTLDHLHEHEITLFATPEPDLTYLFKHIVTYEVTYESLTFATRARLHEQLGLFLEAQVAAGAIGEAAVLDALVYHYTRSNNEARKRKYLQRASAAALQVSAFDSALEYLTQLLAITSFSDPERSALERQVGDVHSRLGDYQAAEAALERALAAAPTDADRAATRALMAEITFQKGDYTTAQTILRDAIALARASSDMDILGRALSTQGRVDWRLGNMGGVVAAFEESLALAKAVEDIPRELAALNGLGVAYLHTDWENSERLLTEVLTKARAVGNREREMIALANLGVLDDERANDTAARSYHTSALAIARELGAQYHIAHCLSNLARCERALGDIASAKDHNREALALAHRIGTQYVTLQALCSTVEIAYAEGRLERALALLGLMRRQPAWSNEDTRWFDDLLARWALDPGEVEAGLARGDTLNWDTTIQGLLKEK
ncbi:MAG: AAA family ATPase [Caldilineales bacterium]